LWGLLKIPHNDPIPLTKPIEQHLGNPDFKDAVMAIVEVDLSKISR
jgi:hypothetical protein